MGGIAHPLRNNPLRGFGERPKARREEWSCPAGWLQNASRNVLLSWIGILAPLSNLSEHSPLY